MKKARLRVMAGLAGATLCLFAVTSYAQNTNTTTGTSDPAAQTGAAPTTTGAQPPATTGDATTPAPADQGSTNGTITSTATDVATTDTTTRTFPMWAIVVVAVVIVALLFGLFRGRDKTVIKETYVTPNSTPGARTTGMGTAADDRVVNSRAASGTGTSTGTNSGMNDPNARR